VPPALLLLFGLVRRASTYNLTITLDPELVFIDLPVMVLVSLVCIPVFLTGRRVSRGEGIAFVTGYAVFLAYLLIAVCRVSACPCPPSWPS
jgi:cation:H+ antiporter